MARIPPIAAAAIALDIVGVFLAEATQSDEKLPEWEALADAIAELGVREITDDLRKEATTKQSD